MPLFDPAFEAELARYTLEDDTPTPDVLAHKPIDPRPVLSSTINAVTNPIVSAFQSGVGMLQEGLRESLPPPLEERMNMTAMERLKGAGRSALGTAQAAIAPFAIAGAPITGAMELATEGPILGTETLLGQPREQRSPIVENLRRGAQLAGEVATGVGIGKGIRGLRERAFGKTTAGSEAVSETAGTAGEATPRTPPKLLEAGRPFDLGEGGGVASPWSGPEPPPVMGKTQAVRGPGGRVLRGPRQEPLTAPRTDVYAPEPVGPGPILDKTLDDGLSLGQKLRWNKRQREAAEAAGENWVEREPTIKEYFPDGKPENMPLGSWARLHGRGELGKVKAAAETLTDEEISALPSHMQDALAHGREDVVNNPSWLGESGKNLMLRGKMGSRVLSMTQVAKNHPVLSQIVKKLNDATSAQHALEEDLVMKYKKLIRQAGGDKAMEAAVRHIDTVGDDAARATLGQTVTEFRKQADEWARVNSLDPAHPLYKKGYAPHLRGNLKVGEGKQLRVVLTDDYIPVDVMRSFPSHFKPYFTQARKVELPGDKFDTESMIGHIRAVARGSVWGTPVHHGVLKDLEPLLKQLDNEAPWFKDFVGNYVNYVIGHPGFRSKEGAQKIGNMLRRTEFARTIVGNFTSPIYNSFQRVLTTSEVSVKAAAKAMADETRWLAGDPDVVKLVKEAKIPLESLGPGKLETEALGGGRINRALTWITDKGGAAFGFAERQNRVYTLLAGYHNALAKGATREQALTAGKDLIQKTQFTPGAADRPVWMRGELGQTVGQFKYFQTKMGEYVWNNLTDIVKRGATPSERLSAANKFIKFWGMTSALGGSAAVPLVGSVLEKYDLPQWKGALPYMGIAAKDQLGLGTIVPKDLKSLVYYIPGPALSHARDLLTAAGFDPLKPGEAPTVAARARGMTRAIPVAGVQLERFRKGGLIDAQGVEREPQTFGEAFHQVPMSSQRPMMQEEGTRLRSMLGFQDPQQEKSFELMTELNRVAVIKNRALRDAAQARAVGDMEGANRILREAESTLGITRGTLKISPQSIKAQQEASRMTPVERRRKALGKAFENYKEDTLP